MTVMLGKPFKQISVMGLIVLLLGGQALSSLASAESIQPKNGVKLSKAPVFSTKAYEPHENYAFQQLEDQLQSSSSEPENTGKVLSSSPTLAEHPVLKGGVTDLHVTKGRSQIIKFAQPLLRVSIADPQMADVIPLSPDQIMINGKQRGVTSLVVWDENGQEGIFDLYVQNDTSELLQAVNAVAPNEKIDVRITDDSFIISGNVSNSVVLDDIRKLAAGFGYRDQNFIDLTETPVPQVILEVKIAEASRNVIRNLATGGAYRGSTLALTRLANPIDITHLGLPSGSTSTIVPPTPLGTASAATNVGGLLGSITSHGSKPINGVWDALETRGKLTILAEPTLVCTHGREANFMAGGEFPYVAGTSVTGSPIVSFREYGVKLRFTPWIAIRSQRIEMKIEPEVSGLDRANSIVGAGGVLVPGILSRKTSTVVDLKDGETLMISGIISKEDQNNLSQLPFVGDIPIIGNLFKNSNVQKNERELIVVVTPHIVQPDQPHHLAGGSQ